VDADPQVSGTPRSTAARLIDRAAKDTPDFRMLRILTTGLPIVFIVAMEVVRQLAVDQDSRGRVLGVTLVLVAAVGIVLFSTFVLRLVDRTQRQLTRRNRELAAANAVSSAVRGTLDLDELLDAALDSVLTASGAVEASIVTSQRDTRWPSDRRTIKRRTSTDGITTVTEGGDAIEVPLTTGATTLGTLRLRFGPRVDPRDALPHQTLETIGQQLAGAIQTAELLADLNRGMREGHAFYDVLLQISNQNALPDTLAAVMSHARELLGADEAVLTLNAATARSLQGDGEMSRATTLGDGSMCITPDPEHLHDAHENALVCPVRSLPQVKHSVTVPVRGPEGTFGDVWLARHEEPAFDDGDRRFLATLAELASIAIANAQLFEQLRNTATIAERGRIAREMHDGMAQVLGVTHLRLRALEAQPAVRAQADVHDELADLADLCREAYSDVRESILGLRESSRVDRALMESLRAYLETYQRQSGIPTALDAEGAEDIVLPPRYQVQILRVVQEALTNVRKHSGASKVVVRVRDDLVLTTFVIEDDGHGFDVATQPFTRDGFGLHSMRERMELLGGTLTIDSEPGRGTRVVAAVPSPSQSRPTSEAAHAAG
jgi:two-component system nitrate/nitrite sensor histidine kinase NarX